MVSNFVSQIYPNAICVKVLKRSSIEELAGEPVGRSWLPPEEKEPGAMAGLRGWKIAGGHPPRRPRSSLTLADTQAMKAADAAHHAASCSAAKLAFSEAASVSAPKASR